MAFSPTPIYGTDLALRIADQLGIPELGDSHWAVIDWLREYFPANAIPPFEGSSPGG